MIEQQNSSILQIPLPAQSLTVISSMLSQYFASVLCMSYCAAGLLQVRLPDRTIVASQPGHQLTTISVRCQV